MEAKKLAEKRAKFVGQKFGKLTIIEAPYTISGYKRICRCKCDCGNECIRLVNSLLSGSSKSCGCMKKEASKRNVLIATIAATEKRVKSSKKFKEVETLKEVLITLEYIYKGGDIKRKSVSNSITKLKELIKAKT